MAFNRITIRGDNPAQLKARTPNITLLPGSRGRLEVYAHRVGGVCPVPLGPIMEAPVTADILASYLSPAGVTITDRGGIGGFFSCDAFVDWEVPVTQGQAAVMAAPVGLIVLVGAIGAALVALGWAVSQLVLVVDALVESFGPAGAGIIIVGALALGLLGVGIIARGPQRRST